MTKQTAQTLRSKVSRLSLQLQAIESEPSSPVSSVATPTMAFSGQESKTKSFVLADMNGRPKQENTVCGSCLGKLLATEKLQVNALSGLDTVACKLCATAGVKPEAFTKPFCDFLTENPTVFHAVEYFKGKLADVGYVEVSILRKAGLYYLLFLYPDM
jgi:aminopeptidase I